jgi:hypothetical protein
VAEEEVATLRVFPRLLLGLAGEGLDRSPFSSRVRDGPASTQPSRLPAAGRPATGRPATGPPTATAPGGPGRRGAVGGGAVVRPGSARRAVCGPAGRAMAIDGCCATGHEPMLRRTYACPSTSAHRHYAGDPCQVDHGLLRYRREAAAAVADDEGCAGADPFVRGIRLAWWSTGPGCGPTDDSSAPCWSVYGEDRLTGRLTPCGN